MRTAELDSDKNRQQPEPIKSDPDFLSKRFAIYILGAGFSQPAGLPLASELWDEVKRRGLVMSGRASLFRRDLETYLEYLKDCFGIERTLDQVDIEDFIAFLDVEHYLGLRGKETWSSDGNEAQVVVKTLIGEILTEYMASIKEIPEIYLQFAEMLTPNDIILTFNYDVLLERALETAKKPFRLFPERYIVDPINPEREFLIIDDSREEVVVLKMHGSIDWFSRELYNQLEETRIRDGFTRKTGHPIFLKPEEHGATPLLDGPRFSDDPLSQMFRVRDIEGLYKRRILFHAAPSLLNPSSAKILYSQMLRDFWWGMGRAGVLNFSMAIIGFSLPAQDEYARQVIYRLVKNYQSTYWEEDVWKHKKTPLVMIDHRITAEEKDEYRKRYSFVNWDRAKDHLEGLDQGAIELLKESRLL